MWHVCCEKDGASEEPNAEFGRVMETSLGARALDPVTDLAIMYDSPLLITVVDKFPVQRLTQLN
jgi:hypothetical protein